MNLTGYPGGASVSLLINHFTYHVPSSQDDGPCPHMTTSTTPGCVQSVSTGFKMMHVLHECREKHWNTRPQRRICLCQNEHGGTPTDSNASPARLKQNRAEEEGTAFNFDWQAFKPIAVGKWHATLSFYSCNSKVTHLLHLSVPS